MSNIAVSQEGPTWDQADLIRRLCSSLETGCRAVSALGSSGYNGPDASSVLPEKVISETALLLVMAEPASRISPKVAKLHERLSRRLTPFARSERMLAGMCLMPGLARDYGLAHCCLTHLGYQDRDVDRLLAQSLSAQAASSLERPPHRQMEHDWVQRLWNPVCATEWPSNPSLGEHSILGRPLDALAATREDIYSFTHALMFLTDLGERVERLPRPREELSADAGVALGWCLDQQDYDLAAEVLLTWPLLRVQWSPAAIFGFMVLAHIEDDAGFLPSPATCLVAYEELGACERSQYALATAYHTVYVMGLLCAAVLKWNCAPPYKLPLTTDGLRGAAAAVLTLIDIGSDKRQWRDYLSKLAEDEQDALAPFLLSIALRRTADRHDLTALQSALEIGNRFMLTKGPASQQAEELLHRAACLYPLLRRRSLRNGERESSERVSTNFT